ncbi:hypothetical protein TIFTF001_021809 [Ficus carica]|uniref:Uncharacterized protein n=1 Tax=Ficus carica TaxID=3494 RepID=A0AA88ASZ9_FICCA|nr:hypothetical protein TIFTF001_021809 [Ficus carica]
MVEILLVYYTYHTPYLILPFPPKIFSVADDLPATGVADDECRQPTPDFGDPPPALPSTTGPSPGRPPPSLGPYSPLPGPRQPPPALPDRHPDPSPPSAPPPQGRVVGEPGVGCQRPSPAARRSPATEKTLGGKGNMR